MKRFHDYQRRALELAQRWGILREECVQAQLLKTTEELGELIAAVIKKDRDSKTEFGDVLFCLTVLADQNGWEFGDCLKRAVEKNEKRTGTLVDNVFVRDIGGDVE